MWVTNPLQQKGTERVSYAALHRKQLTIKSGGREERNPYGDRLIAFLMDQRRGPIARLDGVIHQGGAWRRSNRTGAVRAGGRTALLAKDHPEGEGEASEVGEKFWGHSRPYW